MHAITKWLKIPSEMEVALLHREHLGYSTSSQNEGHPNGGEGTGKKKKVLVDNVYLG